MLNRLSLICVVGAILALGASVWAVSAEPAKCPAGHDKAQCVTGTVKSVDATARTLVLTVTQGVETKDVSMKVCPKAKLTADGKEVKFEDLKAGAAVTVCQVKTNKGDTIAVCVGVGGKCASEGK